MTKRAFESNAPLKPSQHSGFTLVELMVAITLSLFVVIALVSVFLYVSRTNTEMAKTNSQIENGRFAIQLLQADVQHAGYWGSYVPHFDNLTLTETPTDAPNAVPDPCLDFNAANWTTAYKNNLIGIPVQTVPSGKCASIVADQQANTDVLVVRHADTCVPGDGNCAASVAGALYFQSSLCSAAVQLGSSSTTIKMAANASSNDNAYTGLTIRLLSGTGAGQTNTITGYNGVTKIATLSAPWTTIPDTSTNYTIDNVDYLLDTTGLNLHKKDCATLSNARKFISSIYYIRTYANTPGDGIPTLMRSQFDFVGGTLSHQTPVALIEGIEGFRVEYGIDNISKSGAAVDYTTAVAWANPQDQTTATNRGDGQVDGDFVRCPPANTAAASTATYSYPAATACTVNQLTNVVVVKIYVLARSREATPGHTDNKKYVLGSTTFGPYNDGFKRHVFTTTVRLNNVSGRRETP